MCVFMYIYIYIIHISLLVLSLLASRRPPASRWEGLKTTTNNNNNNNHHNNTNSSNSNNDKSMIILTIHIIITICSGGLRRAVPSRTASSCGFQTLAAYLLACFLWPLLRLVCFACRTSFFLWLSDSRVLRGLLLRTWSNGSSAGSACFRCYNGIR